MKVLHSETVYNEGRRHHYRASWCKVLPQRISRCGVARLSCTTDFTSFRVLHLQLPLEGNSEVPSVLGFVHGHGGGNCCTDARVRVVVHS